MQEVLSVSELTSAIKKQLESRFTSLAIRGEITNLKEQSSGHLYFTLKDEGSQISAALFRGNALNLKRMPKGGDQVIARGELSVYAPRGNYQLIVREIEFLGVGELLLKLHELKNKLQQKGWFSPALKKKLPKYPKTIGVVTSPTGSVIQDILNILQRRFSGFHLVLNPVKVQGEGAAREIAQAIDQFNQHQLADLLIVGRGGGSLEDLWAFNEEIVAEAIFRSEIPIISAIGHETDTSIADYVADVRAPTPSAAAEIAIAEKAQQLQFLKETRSRINGIVLGLIAQHKRLLERFKKTPQLSSPYSLLGTHLQRIDDLRTTLELGMRQQLQRKSLQLQVCVKQLDTLKPENRVVALKQKLGQLVAHLKAIDPKNLLTKGYCILFQEKSDSVILASQELAIGQEVRIQMHDGQVKAQIQETLVHDS